MLTFFRVKSFSILFISTMFVVFTSAAYNHHKLSVLGVCVFWVLVKATDLFTHLCHGIVLYPPSESFYSPYAGRGWLYAHVCVIPSIYIVYPKSLIGPLAVNNGYFARRGSLTRNEQYILQWYNTVCPPLSLTLTLYLQHYSVLRSLKMPLSRFPQGNNSSLC